MQISKSHPTSSRCQDSEEEEGADAAMVVDVGEVEAASRLAGAAAMARVAILDGRCNQDFARRVTRKTRMSLFRNFCSHASHVVSCTNELRVNAIFIQFDCLLPQPQCLARRS